MFVLTNQRVIHEAPFSNGVVLLHREFEGDERDRYEKNLAKISGAKDFTEKYTELMRQVAQTLIIGWRGVFGDDKKPLEFTEANLLAFLKHPKSEPLWFTAIRSYANVRLLKQEADDLKPAELGSDPDFLPGK